MMIACGPFCSGCSSLLRVEACQRCARTQGAVDTERFFTALEHCVLRGGAYCANGLALRIRQVPRSLRPKGIQKLAAARAQDILVFHLASRACSPQPGRLQHGPIACAPRPGGDGHRHIIILYHQILLNTIVAAAVMCAGRWHQCLYYNAIIVLDDNDDDNGAVEHVNGNDGDGTASGWDISTV